MNEKNVVDLYGEYTEHPPRHQKTIEKSRRISKESA